MMDRDSQTNPEFNAIISGGRLFQEWCCGMFFVGEKVRLNWAKSNQKKIKAEKYSGLIDAVNNNDDLNEVGTKIILPPSHIGSPRWYTERFQDSMAVVRKYGKPDLFITMTASSDWPEISESLGPGQLSHDRPDIVARVFEMKSTQLLEDLMDGAVLGEVIGYLAIVEWQKRGLPHMHILIFLAPKDKPKTPSDIDRIVCAEIPDPNINPFLHQLVKSKMVHGPCGLYNPSSPCMINSEKKCEKGYPKNYQPQTTTTEQGVTSYRRRAKYDGGHLFVKKVKEEEKTFGNRWVVPYNPLLLLKYKCHINVEVCTSTSKSFYVGL